MNEPLKKLADAAGWSIAPERIAELESLFAGTMEDTQPVRELLLGFVPPATVYKAGEE